MLPYGDGVSLPWLGGLSGQPSEMRRAGTPEENSRISCVGPEGEDAPHRGW
jgi:hypothetical protein